MRRVNEDSSLVGELVDGARRDLERYVNAADPNRNAAGQAALRGLNAAIRVLGATRHRLLVELTGADGSATRLAEGDRDIRAVGNSGPGF